MDDYADERLKQLDDLRFSTLDQWPADIRRKREESVNPRPCLTIDKINQYITQVVNDVRQNRPSGKVRPIDDVSDPETAQIFQDVIREIEDQSSAPIAYETALESAVRIGEGYFRFITDYESETSFNQVIKAKIIPNAFSVYLGPHVMPDGSDAEYGYIVEDMPVEKFKREYPGKKFEVPDFEGFGNDWATKETVRVAEGFYFDFKDQLLLFTADGKTITQDEYFAFPDDQKPQIVDQRETKLKSVKWCKFTAAEILDKGDWAGKYIPLVKVIGKEALVDGKRMVWGLVRPAKDSLRMYNYWASTITEKLALSPKTPFIGAVGQFEGLENQWEKANTENLSRLEYNPVDVNGQALPPPQRQQPAPIEAAMIQQLQLIEHDVQTSLGMYKAALGQEQPQQSGRAILALTRESDTGTYHFSANLGVSVCHGYRILIDLIPKIYDTKRVLRMMGEDGEVSHAIHDPTQEVAKRQITDLQGNVKKIYNLGVGTYDVTVTTGPSYTTRRMEAAATMADLANSAKDPASAAVVRYLAVKNSDFNGQQEAVDMLKRLLPPQVQDMEQGPIPPQVQQKMQEMTQQIQMMAEAGQKLSQENQQLKSGQQEAIAKIEAEHDIKMKQLALEERIEQEKARLEQAKAMQDAELQILKIRLDAKTKVEVAEIAGKVDIATSQISAATAATQ